MLSVGVLRPPIFMDKANKSTLSTLLLHALCARLQITLWKAADQQAPPVMSVTITDFGWEFKNDIPVPVMATTDPAPPELVDVIRCQCRAKGKKCSTLSCSCHKEHITCTSYCNCHGEDKTDDITHTLRK